MMKKRILSILAASLMVLSFTNIPVSAKNGDIAGAVYYSDIRAFINDHPIESYNVDGYTAVCAEDLAAYGFSVFWYAESRLLEVLPYLEYEYAPPEYTFPEVTKPAGTYRMPYLETDIQVIANGEVIPSWNIDGRTLIRLQDLTMFGTPVWDAEARTSTLTVIPAWKMLFDFLTPPDMYAEIPDITEFELNFERDQIGQFHVDGKNAPYFSGNNVQLDFSAEAASIRFAFFQNDKGLGSIAAALEKCTNWDYRGLYPGFSVEPRADIADLMTLTISGEEKQIRTVGIIQGNGHVDYILTVDGSYPRESVSSVRITCRIPEDMKG